MLIVNAKVSFVCLNAYLEWFILCFVYVPFRKKGIFLSKNLQNKAVNQRREATSTITSHAGRLL